MTKEKTNELIDGILSKILSDVDGMLCGLNYDEYIRQSLMPEQQKSQLQNYYQQQKIDISEIVYELGVLLSWRQGFYYSKKDRWWKIFVPIHFNRYAEGIFNVNNFQKNSKQLYIGVDRIMRLLGFMDVLLKNKLNNFNLTIYSKTQTHISFQFKICDVERLFEYIQKKFVLKYNIDLNRYYINFENGFYFGRNIIVKEDEQNNRIKNRYISLDVKKAIFNHTKGVPYYCVDVKKANCYKLALCTRGENMRNIIDDFDSFYKMVSQQYIKDLSDVFINGDSKGFEELSLFPYNLRVDIEHIITWKTLDDRGLDTTGEANLMVIDSRLNSQFNNIDFPEKMVFYRDVKKLPEYKIKKLIFGALGYLYMQEVKHYGDCNEKEKQFVLTIKYLKKLINCGFYNITHSWGYFNNLKQYI